MERRTLELLSPAKDVETAKVAILAGADSVYIGAKSFGARAAAGNSIADIEELCKFAHLYSSSVYVTINTILTDAELHQACQLIDSLYNIGVDAIIVQDMGLVKKCKSPIPFHASTQCHLTTPEKAQFLNACGFSTLVLARELSIDEIKKISSTVNNRLECFVHGALCVSYSGQCYLSAAIGGRSGNRGVCAQPCRMKYEFVDANNTQIVPPAHYLSLRDMNRSASLIEMIEAGVSVFKIEGRLKSSEYVKNVTAFYRRLLDKIIENSGEKYSRTSFGSSQIQFEPDPQKTFSRTFTQYHLHGISSGNESFSTPKARGEYIGKITKTFNGGFFYDNADKIFSNGDGIFIEGKNQFGANIQKVIGNKIFIGMPSEKINVEKGDLWRNKDMAFERNLQKPIARKMEVNIAINEDQQSWILSADTCDYRNVATEISISKSLTEISQNFETTKDNLLKNLAKTGETPFVANIEIKAKTLPYLKISQINQLRRDLLESLQQNIISTYEQKRKSIQRRSAKKQSFENKPFSLDKYANIYNDDAKQFYADMGFDIQELAPETQSSLHNTRLMSTRHCILRELGMCKKLGKTKHLKEPFYLRSNEITLQINFDCQRCGMDIFQK